MDRADLDKASSSTAGTSATATRGKNVRGKTLETWHDKSVQATKMLDIVTRAKPELAPVVTVATSRTQKMVGYGSEAETQGLPQIPGIGSDVARAQWQGGQGRVYQHGDGRYFHMPPVGQGGIPIAEVTDENLSRFPPAHGEFNIVLPLSAMKKRVNLKVGQDNAGAQGKLGHESVAGYYKKANPLTKETELDAKKPKEVLYAGKAIFEDGTLSQWNNDSGHFRPVPEEATAVASHPRFGTMLPKEKFKEI